MSKQDRQKSYKITIEGTFLIIEWLGQLINIPSLEMKHKYISDHKLQNVNIKALLEDMELDKINDDELDEFLSQFEMNVTKSIDKHVPIQKMV